MTISSQDQADAEYGTDDMQRRRNSASVRVVGPANGRAISDDEAIYENIFSAIVGQKLLPGTKLKEDVLSEIYRTNRARIREILSRLVHDKVVIRISNRGAFVAKPTADEAREVFTARRLIEGHLVRHLAERRDGSIDHALNEQIERERRVRDSRDFAAAVRECGPFHLVLAELAASPIIGSFLRELISRTSLIIATYERGAPAKCEFDEHQELIACIMEGRADDAVAVMAAHLDGIEARLDLALPKAPQVDLHGILGLP